MRLGTLTFTAEQNEMVAQDHVNCLYRLRSCDVEENVLLDRVHGMVDGAFGARRLIVNRVLNEVDCEPLDVEGQRPVGLLDDSTRVGYIEAYFDHARWGEEALGPLAAGGALRDPDLVELNLLRVEEQAALDVTVRDQTATKPPSIGSAIPVM